MKIEIEAVTESELADTLVDTIITKQVRTVNGALLGVGYTTEDALRDALDGVDLLAGELKRQIYEILQNNGRD